MPLRLKEIRESLNINQRELARRSGVAQGHISLIEARKVVPKVETVEKLARALGVTVAALLGEDGWAGLGTSSAPAGGPLPGGGSVAEGAESS